MSYEQISEMIYAMQSAGFKDKEEAEAWAMSPNPHLNGKQPVYLLSMGRYDLVAMAARKHREAHSDAS